MFSHPIIRIQKMSIQNFRNVVFGEITFPCNRQSDIFAPKGDVLGIYGQNGSGKTSFIDCLAILQSLLSGKTISPALTECIAQDAPYACLTCEFSVLYPFEGNLDSEQNHKIKLIYSATITHDSIAENLKMTVKGESRWSRMKMIFASSEANDAMPFLPVQKCKPLIDDNKNLLDELRVVKILCAKEQRSFLCSAEFRSILTDFQIPRDLETQVLLDLAAWSVKSFSVILNRRNSLIASNTALPFSFHFDDKGGHFVLPIDKPVVIPVAHFEVITQVITTINKVLPQIVPNMTLELADLGTELTEDGEMGYRRQLVRLKQRPDGSIGRLPLKYESEGIKKIISILHLLIAAYNDPSFTLAVDELDAGIFEYLLGELLRIMSDSGYGQLIFTSHNLYPLETLHTTSIVFTTVDPMNRYTQMGNIKRSNNLRSMYLREVVLGGTRIDLYEETSNAEIAHAMRLAKTTERN